MPTTVQFVSNRGPDKAGHPVDVRFIASFETFEEAADLKKKLDDDGQAQDRAAIIFHSLVRTKKGSRPSHETWHVDKGKTASETAKKEGCTPLGFDVFTAPRKLINDALEKWDRTTLCDSITEILLGFSQTGTPGGGA